ncbi:hypothetical protein GJ699_18670 [Duganella sp. FT80W]|uniref:Uncharacterized protein n=1 Tax=Duganella guangzhouensis TaxID=2666084 RepID=A0A6I2L1G6_9BURK|nr:hypothetical protein [Duganella guangzhouensis]MRW92021.1 hypothetical protein [Duganella guangzhouensis]
MKTSDMVSRTQITAAGNTLAPALSILRKLGYTVTRETSNERLYVAENSISVFRADDPLTLLGLVKIYEIRGIEWQPNDEEVNSLLLLESDLGS